MRRRVRTPAAPAYLEGWDFKSQEVVMKRLALIAVGCSLATGAWAAAPAAAQEQTCGQRIASDARYPKQLGAVLAAVADANDAHAKWVGTGSKEAKAEHDKLQQLAKEQRELAKSALRLSDDMRSASKLADVQHDPARAPVELRDALTRLSQETRTFSQMMAEASQEAAQAQQQLMGTGGSGTLPPAQTPTTPGTGEPGMVPTEPGTGTRGTTPTAPPTTPGTGEPGTQQVPPPTGSATPR